MFGTSLRKVIAEFVIIAIKDNYLKYMSATIKTILVSPVWDACQLQSGMNISLWAQFNYICIIQ